MNFNAVAQDAVIPLWPNSVPNQKVSDEKEIDRMENIRWVRNVQNPVIEVYLPSKAINTKRAVLLFPGGGYQGLAYNWEGVDFAKTFNAKGVAGIVVKYRLPISKSISEKQYEVPLQDAQRAIRIVRSKAKEWGIDPEKIGIMGFSAGGHLASSLGVHYDVEVYPYQDDADKFSARPNSMALIYPVISMQSATTHGGSRESLLGKNPSEELISRFSSEKQVNMSTPPTFLLHAMDDEAVPVENSTLFFEALRKNKIPSTSHIYPTGGHGFALALDHPLLKNWVVMYLDWLNTF